MPDRRERARDETIDVGVAEIGEPGNVLRFPGPAISPHDLPVSDLAERLRHSEQKKRQLQRRINALLSRD